MALSDFQLPGVLKASPQPTVTGDSSQSPVNLPSPKTFGNLKGAEEIPDFSEFLKMLEGTMQQELPGDMDIVRQILEALLMENFRG